MKQAEPDVLSPENASLQSSPGNKKGAGSPNPQHHHHTHASLSKAQKKVKQVANIVDKYQQLRRKGTGSGLGFSNDPDSSVQASTGFMNPLNRQQSDFVEDQVQENLALKRHISMEVETNVDEESRLMRSID